MYDEPLEGVHDLISYKKIRQHNLYWELVSIIAENYEQQIAQINLRLSLILNSHCLFTLFSLIEWSNKFFIQVNSTLEYEFAHMFVQAKSRLKFYWRIQTGTAIMRPQSSNSFILTLHFFFKK